MALKGEKSFRSFIKGLVTEANELTFPDSASVDEQNFVLNRDGSRSRRLGVDYEELYQLNSTGLVTADIAEGKQSFHLWESPGGDTTVSLGIVRIKNRLWFLDLLTSNPSANLKNSGNYITISGLSNAKLETAVINNKCILVSEDLANPVLLTYNTSTGAVTQTTITLKIRDLFGVDDGYADDFRPAGWNTGSSSLTAITAAHKYNLRNQGWNPNIEFFNEGTVQGTPTDAIDLCARSLNFDYKYPSNSDVWTLGKNTNPSSGDYEKFSATTLKKNSHSRYRVSRGSFVIDAFNRGSSRMSESDVSSGLVQDQDTGKLTTVASYAQRIFYSGVTSSITGADARSPNYSGYIFFTRVVKSDEDLEKCYQEADPTDPGINDIIASDGGTIQIPEATRIVKIASSQASLLVFCENGIWEVYGDTGGFLATSFQASKISTNGITNANSVVSVGGNFVYWSKAGIYSLSPDSASGRFRAESISLTTIQSLYLQIPEVAKNHCKGYYDEKENRVRWLYNDSDSYSETNYINNYTKELVYDLTLQAWYINVISPLASNSPYIADYVAIPGYAITTVEEAVYAGTDLVQTPTDDVVVDSSIQTARSTQFSFLTIKGTQFTISKYKDDSFKDWVTADGTGADYSSYLITGYELFDDILKPKQVPYIFFYFKRTEDGFSDVSGNLELTNKSSCLVQAQWNWADSANSGKWGTQFQAYRLLRNYIPSGSADPFNYGDGVIVTKNKLRGSGKTLSLKISSEAGKDMKILGWGMPVTMTQNH
jgi:hypothetical protein